MSVQGKLGKAMLAMPKKRRTYLSPMGAVCALMLLMACGTQLAHAERKTTYYHTDGLGSVVAASDENGALLWRKEYAPYGEQLGSAAESEKVSYTGKVHDGSTGLTYFGARYYDPQLGRFMSVDPAGINSNKPFTFNRYAYANANPYRFLDPDGRDTQIALRYYPLGGLAGDKGHAYIYLRDRDTDQEIISRGQPSEEVRGRLVDIFNDSVMKSRSGEGNVLLVTALTSADKSVDSPSKNKGTETLSSITVKDDIDVVEAKLREFNKAVQDARINYRTQSVNSNSYAFTGFSKLTGTRPKAVANLPGSAKDISPEIVAAGKARRN